jgi:hypothetical protein
MSKAEFRGDVFQNIAKGVWITKNGAKQSEKREERPSHDRDWRNQAAKQMF